MAERDRFMSWGPARMESSRPRYRARRVIHIVPCGESVEVSYMREQGMLSFLSHDLGVQCRRIVQNEGVGIGRTLNTKGRSGSVRKAGQVAWTGFKPPKTGSRDVYTLYFARPKDRLLVNSELWEKRETSGAGVGVMRTQDQPCGQKGRLCREPSRCGIWKTDVDLQVR